MQLKMDDILGKVRRELKEASDEKNRQSGMRYFKEEVSLYGVRSADVRRIA